MWQRCSDCSIFSFETVFTLLFFCVFLFPRPLSSATLREGRCCSESGPCRFEIYLSLFPSLPACAPSQFLSPFCVRVQDKISNGERLQGSFFDSQRFFSVISLSPPRFPFSPSLLHSLPLSSRPVAKGARLPVVKQRKRIKSDTVFCFDLLLLLFLFLPLQASRHQQRLFTRPNIFSSKILSPILRVSNAAQTKSHQSFDSRRLTYFGFLLAFVTFTPPLSLLFSPLLSSLPLLFRGGFLFPRGGLFGTLWATKLTGLVAPVRETAISIVLSQMMPQGSSPSAPFPSSPPSFLPLSPPFSFSFAAASKSASSRAWSRAASASSRRRCPSVSFALSCRRRAKFFFGPPGGSGSGLGASRNSPCSSSRPRPWPHGACARVCP